jgi:hypothetical protein
MQKSLFSLVIGVFACAATAGAAEVVVRSQVEPIAQSHSEVVAYWTKDRMLAAQPYDVKLLDGPMPQSTTTVEAPAGPPGFIASSFEGRAGVQLPLDHPEVQGALAEPQPAVDGYSYPPPENTLPIPAGWYGSFAIRNVGKVFFSKGGLNYVCSGSAIGNRGVLTAGHCLSEGGVFHSNWIFVPAYKNGLAPFGVWSQFDAVVFTVWHFNGDFCRDVGAAVVFDQGGQTLAQRIGNLGFAWNQSRLLSWSSHGYPAESPWIGAIQVESNASFSVMDSPGGCTPFTNGIGTRQNGGSSGGP